MPQTHRALAARWLFVPALAMLCASAITRADPRNLPPPFESQSRIVRGLALSPVPLNLRGKNVALVGLGSYLVNAVGACNDCHTWPNHLPGGDPYKGEPEKINAPVFLAGGRPFGPNLVSENITPDANGLPAGLTRDQFIQFLRTGKDPHDANRIVQVMPWNIYGKMTDYDLKAIYEYLRAIPARPDNF